MAKLLHTNSNIFFEDPYMVRVEYKENPVPTGQTPGELDYSNIVKKTRSTIQGTWGYSPLKFEVSSELLNNTGFAMPPLRGYFCFKDEIDALQFRLTVSAESVRVFMWPRRKFTIYEVTNNTST